MVGGLAYESSHIYVVEKLRPKTGKTMWRAEFPTSWGGLFDVHFDDQDHIVTGVGVDRVESQFQVLKLHRATGSVLWTASIAEDHTTAWALELDAAGDILALKNLAVAGSMTNPELVKIDGGTGEVLRVSALADPPGFEGGAGFLDIDAAGDVVVLGWIGPSPGGVLAVTKIDGATGNRVWRTEFPDELVRPVQIEFDASGDVLFATTMRGNRHPDPWDAEMTMVKLAGADGAEIWRAQEFGGEGLGSQATAFALDRNGDPVLAGTFFNSPVATHPFFDMGVVKFDGQSGIRQWRRDFDGGDFGVDTSLDVVFDEDRNPVALGRVGGDLLAVKLAADTGAEICRFEQGDASVYSGAIAIDTSGHFVVTWTPDGLEQLVVEKRDGASCADFTAPTPCSDGLDNDLDGWTDWPDDPSCASAVGFESTACDDGLDNDEDGHVDLADDDCVSSSDLSESCGLGAELVLVLPPLLAWRRARLRKGAPLPVS